MNSKFSRLRPLRTVLLVLMAMSLAFEARQSRAESPGFSEALKKFADLVSKGKYEAAIPYGLKSVEQEKKLGISERYAISLLAMGGVYRKLKRYSDAEPILIEALDVQITLLGEENKSSADTIQLLATNYKDQKKYKQAEPLFEKYVTLCEKLYGTSSVQTRNALFYLGYNFKLQRRPKEAISVFTKRLDIIENTYPPDHFQRMKAHKDLAWEYVYAEQPEVAHKLFRKYIDAAKTNLKNVKYSELRKDIEFVAMFHIRKGEHAKSVEFLKEWLPILEKNFGTHDIELATIYWLLGISQNDLFRYNEAESFITKGLAITETELGSHHVKLVPFLKSLEKVYKNQGRLIERKNVLLRALDIYENSFGPNYYKNAKILKSLGHIAGLEGGGGSGVVYLKRALDLELSQAKPDQEAIATTEFLLGTIYLLQKQYGLAEKFLLLSVARMEKLHGKKHPMTGATLSSLAFLYRTTGRPELATEIEKSIVPGEKDFIEPESARLGYLNVLMMARGLRQRGQFKRAEEWARLALNKCLANLNKSTTACADAMHVLALIINRLGQHAEAKRLFNRSISQVEDHLGVEHPQFANTLLEAATFFISLNEMDEAQNLTVRAGIIIKRLNFQDWKLRRFYLMVSSKVNRRLGKHIKAIENRRELLRLLDKKAPFEKRTIAQVKNDLSSILLESGEVREGIKFASAALEEYNVLYGPDAPMNLYPLMNLAMGYRALNKIHQAELTLKKALGLISDRTAYVSSSLLSSLSNSLGLLYLRTGRHSEAEELLTKAFRLAQKQKPTDYGGIVRSLTNLSGIYRMTGREKLAEGHLQKAKKIHERYLGTEDIFYARLLQLLSESQIKRKDIEPAMKNIKASIKILERIFGENHQMTIPPLKFLLSVKMDNNIHDDELISKLEHAITANIDGKNIDLNDALYVLALAKQKDGLNQEALSLYRRISTNLETNLSYSEHLYSSRQDSFLSMHEIMFEKYTSLVLEISKKKNQTSLEKEAYQTAQRAKNTAAIKTISRMSVRFTAKNPALSRLIREYQDEKRRFIVIDKNLDKKIIERGITKTFKQEINLQGSLIESKTRITKFEKQIRQEFPQYFDLIRGNILSIKDTQDLLKPHEALFFFMSNYDDGKGKMIAFCVRKNNYQIYRVESQYTELYRLLLKLRLAVERKETEFDIMRSWKLYHLLFAPAASSLKGVTKLIVVPSGALNFIPLNFLVEDPRDVLRQYGLEYPPGESLPKIDLDKYRDKNDEKRGLESVSPSTNIIGKGFDYSQVSWLSKKYSISILPSVAALYHLRKNAKKSSATKPLIAFGDPTLSGRRGSVTNLDTAAIFRGGVADVQKIRALPSLPDTALEIRNIADYLQVENNEIFLGPKATERNVKKLNLANYRYLVFATHGLLDKETQKISAILEPALVMTPPKFASEVDDGLLTASEIAQLKLDADFVILSACNTASGKYYNHKSLGGLSKAFFYAGARSLLASHWPVASKAATKLTTQMFENLKKYPNISRAEAFRRSMMSLASIPEFSHPFYWAPFSVIGD